MWVGGFFFRSSYAEQLVYVVWHGQRGNHRSSPNEIMRIFVASAALALFVGCTKPSVALIKNVTHSTNAVFEVHGEEPIPLSTGEMATIKRIVERFADHPHLMEKKAIP